MCVINLLWSGTQVDTDVTCDKRVKQQLPDLVRC